MKKIVIGLLTISILMISCSKDMELEQSIFIADPEFPGLPEYSEWGYNTFGAYYDREVFVSNTMEIPLKVIVTSDTTSFSFKGQKGGSINYYSSEAMNIRFIIPGFFPMQYSDLIVLNESTVDIGELGGDIEIYINNNRVQATILNGILNFNRVQRLVVDDQEMQLILSGYFFFQAIINGEPISISNGRFDVGVGASNFFDLSAL
ncbi:MAG: hypothetical protein HN347_04100 [Bacteroidetes bacterium]|jgi:hypothetical protein|nr:hypothetical protein [Bacteroidota bacterium]MBT7144326.1 hypothetical protein [Bacteroidota bacterium]